ncbi:hypothetical protein HanRHA438_Chr09g0389721 [Helianthus annuus]|nr:hypothetical protein HanIR_Chr09g0407581 [Helianthus annuus]KAJ0541676.1 hypothetical protein HanHA89_Chr09g0331211 [Helianthus annuus]KAJ0706751.1 hypothetical protein HanLR1_Chr09g0310651 [Helianthus annuus]KAJ0710784.1 hypothetical protein HanOQP8_Chr09g0316351 [Helianthus annuus]KAJ0887342.1 hypothetical protein HanRHA438_Chr09g0389721 [Helianthus annuus]
MSWRSKKSRLPAPLPEDFYFDADLYANLIKEAGRVQKFSEHILVMGRISMIWSKPEYYPTIKWGGKAMGLKEALRLKSFDSKELDVRATKTPKGDPPYLTIVKENLYSIRELVAEAGQGGSASVPLEQTTNVSARTAPTGGGDERKETGSSDPKDTDKVVLYGSVHMSVEDEGVNAGGGENEEDDDEFRPQVSFKRRRGGSSKADLNPKKLKKTKGDKVIILEDEVDQVTGFSVAGGLLENLDAHLHGGRTPRDQHVNLPLSPLSFGGQTTKVIDVTNMPDPSSLKKIDLSPSSKLTTGVASNISRPSPQQFDGGDSASSSPLWYETEAIFLCRELGSGGAMEMDSAQALERYVPDWSLVNKDRIVDALSAKMSLFHIGTPAEHAHYRKMSGPELGNTLMLNQAQSNSLVVETYKRWVEAESNCRRFEREIASLKNEDNVRSKTKQEITSLRAQADRLKEQVSEAKEVSKASQASAAAAYEARDKAVQDIEDMKVKFGELEKKLSDGEKRNKAELKEMHTPYDQLLADHHRLINGTIDELERARDRAIESHKAMIDKAKGKLTRCDGEMVELYAQVLELMTDGVAWVVKLVHQSPELEKVVADLVNSVNAVGVNEGIKQGFKAAKGSVQSAEEVLGYDEGAKDVLDAAIKAFDNFHISVLDKVSELVNEPLSVIKQKSELPIVKED